ncbi:Probable inactive ubiquitin-specific-processing protease 10 [Saitozyma sp. JCM 24511]|nr:Probable inactive ubiquitin-specific-processing protease 10 [Saitozyma sp. JCM 24511]
MPSSPPTSPPVAKRPKLDSEASTSVPNNIVPLSPSASPHRTNGHSNGSAIHSANVVPSATSAPSLPPATAAAPTTHTPADSDDEEPEPVTRLAEEEDLSRRDMYLDTVARQNLDFDFERLCSKSLSNINVYACLVCGKYFQGRGRGSWAYRHSVGENHRVWLNLQTEKFYVLPEGYVVSDPSLNDILRVLNPRYKSSSLPALSDLPAPSHTLAGTPYIPGYIGLNNIKKNDYLNVILQLILHVPPVRNFFLDPASPQLQESARPSELVNRLATLARRLWNPHLFKSQISPHEFLQEVAKRSGGKFKMTEQGDPVEFLGWLVNTLHRDLGGTKKRNSSVIYSSLQGKVQIETQQIIIHKEYARPVFDIARDIQTNQSPFLFLALDLPATPLFQDANEKKIIPQVSLASILAKFDGKTTQEFGPTLKRHHLMALPPYLILHIKRFTKNNFVEERNPTIVNFPLRGVELSDYVDPKPSDPMHTQYDLLANVSLDTTGASTSSAGTGPGVSKAKRDPNDEPQMTWKIHVRAGRGGGDSEKWFELQDLRVEEVRKEMVFLGETVVQVWERRDLSTPKA